MLHYIFGRRKGYRKTITAALNSVHNLTVEISHIFRLIVSNRGGNTMVNTYVPTILNNIRSPLVFEDGGSLL